MALALTSIFKRAATALRPLYAAAAALVLTTGLAAAAPLNWTITGPGTTGVSGGNVTTDLSYNLDPAGFSTVSWTASTVAQRNGTYTIDWDYSGFHGFFAVTAFLNSFSPVTQLVSTGPENCCTSPSGGFSYSGSTTFAVMAGDVFGFTMGGSNFDTTNILRGTLSVAAVPLPGAFGLAALGLGALGFAKRRKRKAVA